MAPMTPMMSKRTGLDHETHSFVNARFSPGVIGDI
jgi:hypothetical protein